MSTTTTTTTRPSTTGLKYTYKDGDSYKDWYLANTGKEWDGTYLTARPEGMSDADWTQGMLMQQFDSSRAAAEATRDQTKAGLGDIYKQQTSAAQQSFNSMANQYGQQMKSELEYAGVLHERMKKYLPQQMAAQGMGGMGITQTAGANAVAKHISNRGAIIGQNQAAMNELNRTHGERQAAIDTEYSKGMLAADDTYNSTIADLNSGRYEDDLALFGQTVKEKEDEQEEYYLAGLSGIKEATTREEALALAEQMKPYVSQAQYDRLVVEANKRGNVLDGIAEEDRETDLTEGETRLKENIEGATSREEAQEWLNEAIENGLIRAESKSYFENMITNKFNKADEENTQEGYDQADTDLRTLYQAGASSVNLRAAYESLHAAGKIEPGRETFWNNMIRLRTQDEADAAAGRASEDQRDTADFGLMLLGEAATAQGRTDILIQMAIWKGEGKITQTQYDEAVQYCKVLDGNADYLQQLEAGDKAALEQAQLVDDIIDYVVGVARNYAKAEEFFKKQGEGIEFTEAEKRSIDIALEMRKNMDEDDALAKMTEEQSAAYDQCVSMLGLCKTTAKQLETLEKFKDKLAPEVYEELKMVLEFQAEDPDVQATEKETAREDEAKGKGYASYEEMVADIISGNATVEYGGKSFRLKDKPLEQSGNGTNNAGDNLQLQKITEKLKEQGYQRWNDVNIENGTAITINYSWAENASKKSETFFYYNGAWYPAKEQ